MHEPVYYVAMLPKYFIIIHISSQQFTQEADYHKTYIISVYLEKTHFIGWL